MNARKLPSGTWRARAFDYTDKDGKKHYVSFTAATKAEAEAKAARFSATKSRKRTHDLTVEEALEGYIKAKEAVLSPSTIREYRKMQKSRYDEIAAIRIKKIGSPELQNWVSALSATLSPKSVSNAYGLLSSALAMYMPDSVFRVTLPKRMRKTQTSPSDEDVAMLFQEAGEELKKCIALAAFGSLRRGEICALTFGDLDGNILHVHADVVEDSDGNWVYKDMPKTSESVRNVLLPENVTALLGSGPADENIIKYKPCGITTMFTRLRNRLGMSVRFHDLRHYFASIGAVLGVPDTYLSGFGGWRPGSPVMKSVYQNKIIPMAEVYSEKMASHFCEVMKCENSNNNIPV